MNVMKPCLKNISQRKKRVKPELSDAEKKFLNLIGKILTKSIIEKTESL